MRQLVSSALRTLASIISDDDVATGSNGNMRLDCQARHCGSATQIGQWL